jgi:7-cyano-7-deazaguanine synthase
MKAVTLLSGGMDSTTLAYELHDQGAELIGISFDYGQRHRSRELAMAMRTAERLDIPHSVVDLRSLTALLGGSALTDEIEVPEGHYSEETMKATVVPNRNAIMLSIATGVAVANQFDTVACAVHAGDHPIYPDCRPEFIEALDRALSLGTQGFAPTSFSIYAPFVHLTKAEIAALGNNLGVPWEDTWSCYVGGEQHCGRCGTCVERAEAFDIAGVEDPTEYVDAEFWKGAVASA